jgi:hypothetical protein
VHYFIWHSGLLDKGSTEEILLHLLYR